METEVLGRVDCGSKNLNQIPPAYPNPEGKADEVFADDSLLNLIPVIDMSKLLLGQQYPLTHHDDELERLHLACKEWGFFQLINHGVPEEVIEKMKSDTEEFFKLPLEKKKAYSQLPNNFEGYGRATAVVSGEEKLDWGDMLFLVPLPASERNMRFWPTHPTSFGESTDRYSRELHKVTICLLKFMSQNLGVDLETLTSVFEDGRQSLRLNLYPPCEHANKVAGLAPHSDISGLTLLVQLNDVQGLEIMKNAKWVPVKPIPGAFIINIGDILEMMSNGEYKSIEHRVIVNTEVQRLSIGAFHCPHLKTIVGPLPDLVKKNVAKYKSIKYEDYLKKVHQAGKLDGKSLIEQMKLEQ